MGILLCTLLSKFKFVLTFALGLYLFNSLEQYYNVQISNGNLKEFSYCKYFYLNVSPISRMPRLED